MAMFPPAPGTPEDMASWPRSHTAHPSPSRATSGTTSGRRKSVAKVSGACAACRRRHIGCDMVRPCTKCVQGKREHECIDTPTPRKLQQHQPATLPFLPDAFPPSASFPSSSSLSSTSIPFPAIPKPTTTLVMGTNMKIMKASNEGLRMLGFHSHEMIDQSLASYIASADRPRFNNFVATAIEHSGAVAGHILPMNPVQIEQQNFIELCKPIRGTSSFTDTFKVRDFARNYTAYDIKIYLGSFFGATISDLSTMDRAVVVAKLSLKKDDLSSGSALPALTPLGSKPSTARRPSIQGGLPPTGHRKSTKSSYALFADFGLPPLPTSSMFMPPLSAGSSNLTFSSSLSTSSSAHSLGLNDTFGLGDPLSQRPPSRTRRSSTSLGYSSQLPTLAPLPLFPSGSSFGSSISGANSGLGGGGHGPSSSFDSSGSSLSNISLFGSSPSRSASSLRSSTGGGGGFLSSLSSSSSLDAYGPGWPYTTSSYSSGTPTSSPPRKRSKTIVKKYQLLPSISTWAGPLNIPSNFANLPSPPPLFPPTPAPLVGVARLPRSRTGSMAGSSYDFPPTPAFRPSSSLGRPTSRSGLR